MKCDFRSAEPFQTSPTHDHPDIYRCGHRFRFCTLQPSGEQTADGPIQDCLTCVARVANEDRTNAGLEYLVCDKRGLPSGDALSCNCSIDRTIYLCPLKGRCIKRLPAATTRDDFKGDLLDVTICSECEIPKPNAG